MAEHVTAGEFERWMRHLDERIEVIIKEQKVTNGRVTALEINAAVVKRISAAISGAVSAVVGLLVGAATSYLLR